MRVDPTELAAELRALRKGRGAQKPNIQEQVGPALRELCGISESDDAAAIRHKVTSRLADLARELPQDLRLAAVAALGLQEDTQQQFLKDRVRWLADRQQRDGRTIRRRIDQAMSLLAEVATSDIHAEPRKENRGWHTRRFEAVLRMDKPTPECLERRWIVAEQDGLDEIQVSITLPPGDDGPLDLLIEPYHGVALVARERRAANRFAFVLRLPRTLHAGDEHEYALVARVPDHQPMREHYVFVPERRCDEFDLRVRFDPDHGPDRIWSMAEVFHREIDERTPADLLELDRVGEVHLYFDDLIPGRGYGAQWSGA